MIKLLILSLMIISCNSETFSGKVSKEYEKLTPQIYECKEEIDSIAKSLVDRTTYTDNSGLYFKTINLDLDDAIKKLIKLDLRKLKLNDEWKFNQLLIKNCSVENFKFFFSYLKESNFCSGALFELLAYYRALGSDLIEKKGSSKQIEAYKEKLLKQIQSITTNDSSFLEQLIALNFLQTLQEMKLIGSDHGEKIKAMVKKYDLISGSLGKKRLYSLVNMNEKQMNEVCTTFTKLFETESKYAKEVSSQINAILEKLMVSK